MGGVGVSYIQCMSSCVCVWERILSELPVAHRFYVTIRVRSRGASFAVIESCIFKRGRVRNKT